MKYIKSYEYYEDEDYSKIENLEIIEKIIPLIDECPELIWETDYPAIPIGGENPLYV